MIQFDTYQIDPVQGLRANGRDVHLTPKALMLLHLLASRAGEVVTKPEIFRAVWPVTTVSDAALTTCIQELRRALKDDAHRPRYLETRHGRGYRFVGVVIREPAKPARRIGRIGHLPSRVAGRDRSLAQFHLRRALTLIEGDGSPAGDRAALESAFWLSLDEVFALTTVSWSDADFRHAIALARKRDPRALFLFAARNRRRSKDPIPTGISEFSQDS